MYCWMADCAAVKKGYIAQTSYHPTNNIFRSVRQCLKDPSDFPSCLSSVQTPEVTVPPHGKKFASVQPVQCSAMRRMADLLRDGRLCCMFVCTLTIASGNGQPHRYSTNIWKEIGRSQMVVCQQAFTTPFH